MPNNKKLEKNQRKAYKEDRGDYTFQCKTSSCDSVHSPVMRVKKPGIYLHFLRFGLFDKNNDFSDETDVTAPERQTELQKAVALKDKQFQQYTVDLKDEYSKDETDTTPTVTLPEVDILSVKDIPKTDNFYTVRTALRQGYIYLINDEDPDDYYELEVDSFGFLSHVLWEYNKDKEGNYKDIRHSENEKITAKLVKPGKKLWVAYSPVQWSRDFHHEMNTNADKRKKLMELIDCSGFKKGEQSKKPSLVPYNKVHAVFHKDHVYSHALESNLYQIHADEKYQDEKGNNEVLEDMFLTLHDPVGCADDIAEQVGKKTIEFKAFVDAIQTGESLTDALDRYSTIPPKPAPEPDADYRDMFSLALASYKMIYSSKENTKKYDGGKVGVNWTDNHFPYQPNSKAEYAYDINVHAKSDFAVIKKRQTNNYVEDEIIREGAHREKIEGIIGALPRRKMRKLLNAYRDDLGTFIQTDYYKKGLRHYTNNAAEYFVFGILEFFDKIRLLYTNPYNIDRHLLLNPDNLLEQDRYIEKDKWVDWINTNKNNDTPKNEEDPIEKIWAHDLSVSQKLLNNWPDLINKFVAIVNAKLEIHSLNSAYFKSKTITSTFGRTNYQQILDEGQKIIVKRLNKITVTATKNGKPMQVFHFSKNEGIQIDAKALGIDFDPNLQVVVRGPKGKDILEFQTELIQHNKLRKTQARAAGGAHEITIGDNVKNISKNDYTENKINRTNAKRFNQKAYDILNSRGFTSVLTGLQLINFSYASLGLYEAIRKESTFADISKNIINTSGIAAELTEASLNLYQAHQTALGKKTYELFGKHLFRARIIGGVITSVMCFWEGILAFNKRDSDAAIAWGLAGVAFGAAIFLSGPIGWIVLGIGFVLVALANIFTDSELQWYFKNFLLSDKIALPVSGRSPMAYNRYLFKNQENLVNYKDEDIRKTVMHPADAIATLHDLTVCNEISYYMDKRFIEKAYDRHQDVFGFGISLNFNQFLNTADQVEATGVLLNTRKYGTLQFKLLLRETEVVLLENGQKQFNATVVLPKEYRNYNYINYNTELIVALRININKSENHYFPHPLQHKTKRYLAVKFKLHNSSYESDKDDSEKEKIVIDSLKNLKLGKTW